MRREIGNRKTAVLWGVASRICSKQHVAIVNSSHIDFSPSISLMSMWCDYAVVLT